MQILKEKSFLFLSLKKYALDICGILGISCPNIKVVSNTETLATYYPTANLIEINEIYDNDYNLAFAIAHELRYVWQLKYKHAELEQSDYIMFNQRTSDDEYYLQPIEIDAIAFSLAVNYVYLNITITSHNYSEKVIKVLKPKVQKMIEAISLDKCPPFEYKKPILN